MKTAPVACAILLMAACRNDTSPQRVAAVADVAAGHERGDCRADKTCDPGLLCLSNLCVRPPGADCQVVSDQLASIELGNYAEVETRAPIVATYKAACEKAYVSKDEGACIAQAHDKWSASQCAPRMFPELASASTGDCAKIADRVRTVMATQTAPVTDPTMRTMYDQVIAVVQQSCDQDHWPDALKQCVLTTGNTPNDLMTVCNTQMPPGLQQKLTERIMTAVQKVPR